MHYLKKNLGIIIKHLEESGVVSMPTALDHEFRPDINVTDAGLELPIRGFLYSIKAHYGYAPVKYNINRPIDTEYDVVFPGTVHIISRMAEKIYLKAPVGQASRVTVKTLKM